MRIKLLFSAALLLAASTLAWAGPEKDLAGNEVFNKPSKQIDFGKLKFLKNSDTILIPFVEVKLQNWGTQGALAKTKGFGSGASQTAQARSTLSVAFDPKLAQELATEIHQDLVEQMRSAGWKVITLDDIQENKHVKKLKWEKEEGNLGKGLTVEKKDGKVMGVGMADSSGAGYVIAVPEGQQFLESGITGPAWPFRKVVKDVNANVYIPTYYINTVHFDTSEKSRSNTASANVSSGALVSLGNVSVYYLNPKAAGSGMTFTEKGYGTNTGVAAGTVVNAKDTSPKAANALGSVFRAVGGAGIQNNSSEYIVESDETELKAEALKLARAFNDVAARATALYKGK